MLLPQDTYKTRAKQANCHVEVEKRHEERSLTPPKLTAGVNPAYNVLNKPALRIALLMASSPLKTTGGPSRALGAATWATEDCAQALEEGALGWVSRWHERSRGTT